MCTIYTGFTKFLNCICIVCDYIDWPHLPFYNSLAKEIGHWLQGKAQHLSFKLHPYPDHAHQQRPMPTHSMKCAHPCPPMLFKLCLCIQKLCNVHYPPTPSLGWIGQIKGRSLLLASARSTSWLEYSLHPRSLTLIWGCMQGCTKPNAPRTT